MVTAQHECWLRGSAIHLGPQIIQMLCKKLLSCFFCLFFVRRLPKMPQKGFEEAKKRGRLHIYKYLIKNSLWKLKFDNGQNAPTSLTFVDAFSQRVQYTADMFRYFTQSESLVLNSVNSIYFAQGEIHLGKQYFWGDGVIQK